jgi:hypothetical protein
MKSAPGGVKPVIGIALWQRGVQDDLNAARFIRILLQGHVEANSFRKARIYEFAHGTKVRLGAVLTQKADDDGID